ncbi:phosphoglycolate phosphatase [Azonexus sp.]|uniref:phosphoglycolate phosphatase n=1 Tax=Azonexus sp. TaxID=1872668 RepID=UPI0027B90454|nr:phosphoglycolate phosphatase [Azonexus sp.]
MKFKSVTFDLDGTLLDTVGDLTEACRRMMLDLDLPPRSEAEIRSFVGQGMLVLVRRCLDQGCEPAPGQMERAVAAFQQHYAAVNGENTRFFSGVREGLAAWQATGLPLGIVTNKPAAFTEPLLIRTGLAHYFSCIVSGDTTPHRKPHPAPLLHACAALGSVPADNLHIGDSKHDIETARQAGCTVYCVPYGYNEGELVRAEDCDALVADLGVALRLARSA